MADYTLIASDGTAYDLEDVVIDNVNDTVSFVAAFRRAPAGSPQQ